jgi:hypothetical protein
VRLMIASDLMVIDVMFDDCWTSDCSMWLNMWWIVMKIEKSKVLLVIVRWYGLLTHPGANVSFMTSNAGSVR